MVDRIADILGDRGDTDLKEVRRAKAIGVLATPARAHLMLSEAAGPSSGSGNKVRSTDPRLLPEACVYVHVAVGSLWRKPHRAKTHAGWLLEQPKPGIFWWETPTGERYRIAPNGTSRIGRNPSHRAFEKALWDADHELGPPVQGVG